MTPVRNFIKPAAFGFTSGLVPSLTVRPADAITGIFDSFCNTEHGPSAGHKELSTMARIKSSKKTVKGDKDGDEQAPAPASTKHWRSGSKLMPGGDLGKMSTLCIV